MRALDNTAPRFRPFYTEAWNAEFFDTLSPELKKYGKNVCKNMLTQFGELVHEEIRNNRNGVKLPMSLGIIVAGTCPKKTKLNPNWVTSTGVGKIVNHQNWESDQKTGKIFYTNCSEYNGRNSFIHGNLWYFKATQLARKKFSKEYREKWMNYIQILPRTRIRELFKNAVHKDKKQQEHKGYNPFED